MTSTVQKFEQFYGSEHYYEYKNGYAYTDAIDFLQDQLQPSQFEELLDTCISFLGYKYNFGFFELQVYENCSYLVVDDGNGHTVCRRKLEINTHNCGLDEGPYHIWCHNYVIYGRSEH